MKHHVMLALGLVMSAIFAFQGANALMTPGLGLRELYIAGGLVLAGWLVLGGLSEWKAHRARAKNEDQAS